jgi:uncharacterized beta-barrel protein YwiB (DUF1934 family)
MNKCLMGGSKKPKIVGNDVKVIWDDVETTTAVYPYLKGQLHLTATHEGIILDFIDKNGKVVITQSILLDDLVHLS